MEMDVQDQRQNHAIECEVLIIGAGPVGLTLANTLGLAGVRVVVVEKLPQIIDYPRAIGIDDESLRALQTAGLAAQVQEHITPDHWMRFFTAQGQCFAAITPSTDEFGWSRRNAFIQPQVDAILYEGLQRFQHVQVLLGHDLVDFKQDVNGVFARVQSAQGQVQEIAAQFMVGADGGQSGVRRQLNVAFEGRTKPNQWIVVDVRNDPLGTPHIDLHCDPRRPYVSAALPHGIRRFEFMVMPGETEQALSEPANLAQLMRKVVAQPEKLDYIRKRVYTHNARLAAQFKVGRVLLAGDAAHIMPVWQGQGYNSGMRDASNLAWKLAMVVQGQADIQLLDTYEQERRQHAQSMIHLSEVAGDIFAPETALAAKARDAVMLSLNALPMVKQYFAEMRFKPMPQYETGAVLHTAPTQNSGPKLPRLPFLNNVGHTPWSRMFSLMAQKKESPLGRLVHGVHAPVATPVGRMFIQPQVQTQAGQVLRLDDVIGLRFAVLAWGTDPMHGLDAPARAIWRRLGARFIRVVPVGQLGHATHTHEEVLTIGDLHGRLKAWFGAQRQSIVILRPDRFVAAQAAPQDIADVTQALARVLFLTDKD